MMHIFDVALKLKEDRGPSGELPIDEVISALEVAISVTNQKQSPPTASSRVSNKMPPKSAPAPSTTTLEEKLQEEGQTVLNHGSYKNRTFFEAWQDQAYVKWCLDHCTTSSSPGMKKLSSYFREMKANHMPSEKQPTALMAIRQIPGSEEDILAILDTGRNATCYGASWLRKYCVVVGCEPALQPVAGSGMKGFGGKMKLAGQRTLGLSFELENGDYARGTMTSLEIGDSDAPLLLSIETQRQLGFVIDLNKKKVSSDILGSNVKVVNRGGLMAIPLIPG